MATSKPIIVPTATHTAPPKTIPSPIGKPGSSSSFNLGDEQKRWLVVGICLNKILLPSLRGVLKPEIKKLYSNLKSSHNIHIQTFGTHLKKDASFKLNYGSINNNEMNHGKSEKLYDYTVKSEIDLAKLYLRPYMATFSAFDDTCDLSAALGILSSASVFANPIPMLSKDVRKDVRNEWGHCNFSKWTAVKFLKSFQLMDSLVRSLPLTPAQEKKLRDELNDWETKGMQLCMGHIVDADLVKLIEAEVAQLSLDVKNLETTQQEEAKSVTDALKSVFESIEEFKENITKALKALEDSNQDLKEKFLEVSESTSTLSADLKSLEISQQCLAEQVEESKEELTRRVDEVELKQENIDERVKALENAIESKSAMSEGSTFQAPNRIPCFYGREKEVDLLQKQLHMNTSCRMSAICGLGGTGKTSLAIEHIWKARDTYNGGVFWLAAESLSLFQNSMSEIARLLGTFDEDFTKTMSKTLHWLQSRKDLWCLVIDNLDEYDLKDSPEIMKLLCGHWQRNATGHIIITTRREMDLIQEDIPNIPKENCIHLGNLTENESIHFLKMRTEKGSDEDDETLKELAAELGCLPLALDQAAAYIKYTKVSFSDYLEHYKKQTLKTLSKYKARYPAQDTAKERIAVHTTWELNFEYVHCHSEEYGIGQAAALIMEVSAFLYSDDIPLGIINEGLPRVTNEDLHNCLSSPVGPMEIVSTLTKFSLFQKFTDNSISVHRLVQEVIRSNMSKDRQKDVLQSASRMLHHAFANTNSPEEVCKSFQGDSVFIQTNLPSLSVWGTLGAHANALQSHLLSACKKDSSLRHHLLYTEETAELLNEASVYLSVCRQKVEALELQKTKLEIMTRLDTASEEKLAHLRYFEIPLKNVKFKLISHCIGHQQEMPKTAARTETANCKDEADKWRGKGNEVFKRQDYGQAVDLYTLALKYFNGDCKSLCNRALCYLKMNKAEKALEDCERCLKLERHNHKALIRKAWALLEISKTKPYMSGRVKATAALAVYTNPAVSQEPKYKQMFHSIYYKEVSNSKQFMDVLSSHFVPGMSFLLHKGCYDFPQGLIITRDLQLVAIGDHVSLISGESTVFLTTKARVYFEGISFLKGGYSIDCALDGSITMYNCHVSSGRNGCQDFPDCKGGSGCVNTDTKACLSKSISDTKSGIVGYPAIQINNNGYGYFEKCDIEECGGGGILSHGKGSEVHVKACKVHNNRQAALEAREGGCLEAIDNDIYSGKYHGIMIGPFAGACSIIQNRIYENGQEGIFVLQSMNKEVVIKGNRIYHNLSFGISLDRCQVHIEGNDIFENGFYGINAKNVTTAMVESNDIYSNKCGGIHMGINFSGRFIIARNTVRDHSGQWLIKQDLPDQNPLSTAFDRLQSLRASHNLSSDPLKGHFFLPQGETRFYSNPPTEIDNEIRNNKEGMFHPKRKVELVQKECAFCRSTKHLFKCMHCNTASYCSVACQANHKEKHKSLCLSLFDEYCVTVEFLSFEDKMANSQLFHIDIVNIRTFGSHLKGIGEGPKPSPNNKERFIVKIQTNHNDCRPLQYLILYDQSTTIDGHIQSPEVFHMIMECGVIGQYSNYTSKKAFFYATFADRNGKKLKIDLSELAPYQEW